MAIEDDDRPRKKVTHEIGQDLSLLSVEELTERIALMNSEIERLQQAMTKKRASKDAANRFFQIVGGESFRSCKRHLTFEGTTIRAPSCPNLGQWPTWQTNPEENRSFTNC